MVKKELKNKIYLILGILCMIGAVISGGVVGWALNDLMQ